MTSGSATDTRHMMDLTVSAFPLPGFPAVVETTRLRILQVLNRGVQPLPGNEAHALLSAAARSFDREPEQIERSDHARFYATLLDDADLHEAFLPLATALRAAPTPLPAVPSRDELAPYMEAARERFRREGGVPAELQAPIHPRLSGVARIYRLLMLLVPTLPGQTLVVSDSEPFTIPITGSDLVARLQASFDPCRDAITLAIQIPAASDLSGKTLRVLAPPTTLAHASVDGSSVHVEIALDRSQVPAALSRSPFPVPLPPALRSCLEITLDGDEGRVVT